MVLADLVPKGGPEYGLEVPKSEETNTSPVLLEFQNILYFPRKKYRDLGGLVPTGGRFITLQRIPGTMLIDGHEYLVWFGFKSGAEVHWISLKFKFAHLAAKDPHLRETYEKVLGLQRIESDPNSAEE